MYVAFLRFVPFEILLYLFQANLPTNCTLHDDDTCPKGSCCARDEFLFTETQCKLLGKERDSCTTRLSEYECPCSPNLECKPNIIGTGRPSLFGTCQPIPGLKTTTAPNTPSSLGSVATSTTVPVNVPSSNSTKTSARSTTVTSDPFHTGKTATGLPRRNSTTDSLSRAPQRTNKRNDPFIG